MLCCFFSVILEIFIILPHSSFLSFFSLFADLVGVVRDVGETSTIKTKTSNKELTKRDIQLVDSSKALVRLTLWGTDAENFDGANNPILAIKGCRLSDWNGK